MRTFFKPALFSLLAIGMVLFFATSCNNVEEIKDTARMSEEAFMANLNNDPIAKNYIFYLEAYEEGVRAALASHNVSADEFRTLYNNEDYEAINVIIGSPGDGADQCGIFGKLRNYL